MGSASLVVRKLGFFLGCRLGIDTAFISIVSVKSGLNLDLLATGVINLLLFIEHLLVEILVMVVTCKGFLDVLLVQKLHVLLNLLTVLVLPLAVGVVGIEVVGVWRYEWSLESLMEQLLPGEFSHPRMVFDVLRAIET